MSEGPFSHIMAHIFVFINSNTYLEKIAFIVMFYLVIELCVFTSTKTCVL